MVVGRLQTVRFQTDAVPDLLQSILYRGSLMLCPYAPVSALWLDSKRARSQYVHYVRSQKLVDLGQR